MALGIVVDDAIVISENVFAHRQSGVGDLQAAIRGTVEVVPSIFASVATTVIAFCPLFFVSGVMGKFIAVMPLAVIAMLLISLSEAMFVLPCHLAHEDNLLFRLLGFFFHPFRFVLPFSKRVNVVADRYLERFVESVYVPLLRLTLEYRWTTVAAAAGVLIVSVAVVRAGLVPRLLFPKLDSNQIRATVAFPDGTPQEVADVATRRIVDCLRDVERQLSGDNGRLINTIHRTVGTSLGDNMLAREGLASGSHLGAVQVELVPTTERSVNSNTIIAQWRQAVGEIAGTDSLVFGTPSFGPGGKPLLPAARIMAPPLY